ncbi:MAG: hypothetical protein U1D00_16000 [Mycobacterium sp.]|nr:hypothetical protein [Mycobacterium sp.]
MSRRSDAKKARRRKRQAARGQAWLPEDASERIAEIVADLEDFDARLTQRGWVFSEESDDDSDDDVGVVWFWPPSYAEVADSEMATATVVALIEAEGGDIAHVVFVGADDDYQFGLEELFEHIETIEAYRIGEPLPVFAES